jgi:hypothetical protein
MNVDAPSRVGVSPSPASSREMFTSDFFQSPLDRIAKFGQTQVHLYRQDVTLQDYFMALQMDNPAAPRATLADLRANTTLKSWAIQKADKVSRLRNQRTFKADVLLCWDPYFSRRTEIQFFLATLLGLAQTGATIICLLPVAASCRKEAEEKLAAAGRSAQVIFLDPAMSLDSIDARVRPGFARMRGQSALEKTIQILEPHGLTPSREVESRFEHLAYFVESWERLAPCIEFDTVVTRCHWHALCCPVSRTALQRGKQVITFEQGVIGHSLDVPVTVSKYVAFGEPSATFLSRMNRKFHEAVGMPEPPVDYVLGGCLFDKIIDLRGQFDRGTVLIVDIPVLSDDFYGMAGQGQAMLELAERLLQAEPSLRRLVIRAHPYWSNLDLEACKQLVRRYPNRCELSHPAWALEDDLRRASIVVGLTSGVLTVAAASGLPVVFLDTQNAYKTGDQACFSSETLMPDAAFREISKMLKDERAYAQAQAQAVRDGSEYYAQGKNCDFSAGFFEQLLRPATSAAKVPQQTKS